MRKPKFFIAFIGLDGSGKTTLAQATKSILCKQGLEVKYSWTAHELFLLRPLVKGLKKILIRKKSLDNYQDYIGSVRRAVRPKFIYFSYLYLILAEYLTEIFFKVRIPLWLGKSVVADRYIYDTATNIAANLNFSFDQYEKLIKKLLFFSPKPDLVCYISIPEEIATQRKKDIPDIDYLKMRKKYYQELAKKSKIIELDGREKVEVLEARLVKILSEL